jgi:hypothetical protein
MAAGVEEFLKIFSSLRDRRGISHADAIKSQGAGFARERGLQIGSGEFGGRVQKSRST